MQNLGDFIPGAVIDGVFNTRDDAGAPITLAGTPSLAVYKANGTTEDTGDITLTVDFDGKTGLQHFRIDTGPDPTFYATAQQFMVVIAAGTVDGVSVVGVAVARFTLGMNTPALQIPLGSVPSLGWSENGTMQAGSSATTAVLRSATSFADDLVNNSFIYIRSGTGAGQARFITNWDNTSDTATVDPPWTTTPDNTSVYAVIPTPPASDDIPFPATLGATELTAIGNAVRTELSPELNNIDEAISTRASQTSVNTIDDLLDTEMPALTVAVADLPTNAELATALGTADDATLAAIASLAGYVDTEVAAILAILQDARAEPGQGTPAVNASLAVKIDYLYKAWRNRSTQTSSQYSLYGDDATTVHQKASFSDNGTTADRGEVATGP